MVDPASTPTPDAANLRECIPSNKQSTRPRTTPATTATACVQSADGRKRYLPVAQTQVGRTFYDLRLRLVLLVLRLRLRARRPSPPPSSRSRAHLAHTLRTHGDTPVPHTHTLYRLRYTKIEVNINLGLSCDACRPVLFAASPRLARARAPSTRRAVAVGGAVRRARPQSAPTGGRHTLGAARWTRSNPKAEADSDTPDTVRRVQAPKAVEGVQLSKMCRGSKRSCIY